MAHQSVLIRAPGQSDMRVIVPAAETDGDPVAEAIAMVRGFLEIPSSTWIAEIHETPDVTDVEIKQ